MGNMSEKIEKGLSIYKQKESPYWWIYANLNGDFARISSEEINKSDAINVARYKFKRAKQAGSIRPEFENGRKTIEEAINKADLHFEDKRKGKRNDYKLMLEDIMKKFRHKKAAMITYDDILEDMKTRKSETRVTMRRTCWNEIINRAIDLRLISPTYAPRIPTVAIVLSSMNNENDDDDDDSYEIISDEDLLILSGNMIKFMRQVRRRDAVENREILRDYLKFIYYTGVRAGEEATMIKFKDVKENKIDITGGKIHKPYKNKRTIDVNNRVMKIVERRAKHLDINFNKRKRSEVLVFECKDGSMTEFSTIFNQLLDFTKIERRRYRPYSLRKNFITRMLEKGASAGFIAAHCGTSIAMIDKHYQKMDLGKMDMSKYV